MAVSVADYAHTWMEQRNVKPSWTTAQSGRLSHVEMSTSGCTRGEALSASAGKTGSSAMSWATLLSTTLVPVASVLSTATVAIWTKRIDARTKREDRDHELVLDYEKRAGEDKKAVLKRLISATLYLQRGAEPLAGTEVTEESISRRRAEATRELYEFRARLGLDDGVAELMIYAAEPVRDLTELILDEWDRQFREHGYSLTQLDACKKQLQTAVDVPQE